LEQLPHVQTKTDVAVSLFSSFLLVSHFSSTLVFSLAFLISFFSSILLVLPRFRTYRKETKRGEKRQKEKKRDKARDA